ncbi:MAG: hypothetical protein SF029_02155 [bacterium]|nr:hypothetical protein [bacterium]
MKQFTAAWEVLVQAFSDWWYNWLIFLAANTLWIFGTASFLFAPPALFGLFYVANEAVHKRGVDLADFFRGARRYFRKSWQWGLLNLIAAFLVWTNINFYLQFVALWSAALLTITLFLAVVWIIVQAYTIPYLLEQDVKKVRVALRNGLYTMLASPLYTLVLSFAVFLIVRLCAWQPALMLAGGPVLVALIATHAVRERVETFGLRGGMNSSGGEPHT